MLENPSQDVVGRSTSIEQSMALKRAYNMMKAKLLKYESQVKRKPIFPIATMLDLSLKLEYLPMGKQEYIMQHFKNLLQLISAAPTSSTCTQGETLLSNSTACSKMMVELIKRKRKRNMNILLERPIFDEIFYYLHDSQVEGSDLDALQWWYSIGSEKHPPLAILAKGFLSLCASSSLSKCLFLSGRGIITYKRGRLSPKTISILMTLKSWSYKDEIDNDVEELGEDDD